MFLTDTHDTEKKTIAILKVLNESPEPLGSITIARELVGHGIHLSERAVRNHLRIADERGYTQPMGRDGRTITPKGMEELQSALAEDQVGHILHRLDLLAFYTTFDPRKRTGQLPINTSLFKKKDFKAALPIMREVFEAELGAGELVAVAGEGQKLGDVVVPKGKVGLGTVCSATPCGLLLRAGVPIESRFGGVLEVVGASPRRFVAVIKYEGTSLDPSEQYVRAGMTNVREAVRTGNGKLLANFREVPAPARPIVEQTRDLLREVGISGACIVGDPSEDVCRIGVGPNRIGMVLLGGLNPVAAAAEAGIDVENTGESGMIDFEQLTSFRNL